MSKGHCGWMKLLAEDEQQLWYQYRCWVLGEEEAQEQGDVWIRRTALVEPVIHQRIKKRPCGRRETLCKRIPQAFSVEDMLASGEVEVSPSTDGGSRPNTVAHSFVQHLLFQFFLAYQRSGSIPEEVSWYV